MTLDITTLSHLGCHQSTCQNSTMTLNDTVDHLNITPVYLFEWEWLKSLNYTLPALVAVALVLFVVIIATAFGNFLVFLALFKYRYLRTISNYLIGNLAISDFLLATTILPLSTFNECLGHWIFGKYLCNAWLIMDALYCTASLWNICVIAFDRYTATLHPMWYREKRSAKQAAIYVIFVWLMSAAICLPPVLGWNDLSLSYKFDPDANVYHCVLFETTSYVLYSACGSFYIPFFITVFLYVRIFIVLRERMRKTAKKSKQSLMVKKASVKVKDTKGRTQNDLELMNQVPIPKNDVAVLETTDENSSRSLFDSDSDADDITNVKLENGKTGLSQHDTSGVETKKNELDRMEQTQTDGNITSVDVSHDLSVTNQETGFTTSRVVNAPSRVTKEPRMGFGTLSGWLDRVNPFRQGWKSKEKMARTASQKHRRGYEQREMRATIRMAIIIAFFCGMWIGFFTLYVIHGICKSCPVPRELDAFFFWLGYSNSSVNPILYTIFNEEFRRAFQALIGCYKSPAGGMHGKLSRR